MSWLKDPHHWQHIVVGLSIGIASEVLVLNGCRCRSYCFRPGVQGQGIRELLGLG